MLAFLKNVTKRFNIQKFIPAQRVTYAIGTEKVSISYVQQETINMYQHLIPKGQRILHVNCTDGSLLLSLQPARAIGINEDCFVQSQPHIDFYQNITEIISESFDYVIISSFNKHKGDLNALLQEVRRFCTAQTRIFVETSSYYWQPLQWFCASFNKQDTLFNPWLSSADIEHLLDMTQFEVIKKDRYLLVPLFVPFLSYLFNRILTPLPFFNLLCCNQLFVARLKPEVHSQDTLPSVSVIIPCRNERGNIQTIVERLPLFGSSMEIIFVEGGSADGTKQEIERCIAAFPERAMRLLIQDGKGKADAVRKGFAAATGDVLMILDSDLPVDPATLPHFFTLLHQGKGECINGSRLVYAMESQAIGPWSIGANIIIATFVSWVTGQRVKDTLCGTKVLWKKDYEKMAKDAFFGKGDPFGDFDLLFGAAQLHLKIIDMPITAHRRTYGVTNIFRVRDGLILAWLGMRAFKKLKMRW